MEISKAIAKPVQNSVESDKDVLVVPLQVICECSPHTKLESLDPSLLFSGITKSADLSATRIQLRMRAHRILGDMNSKTGGLSGMLPMGQIT